MTQARTRTLKSIAPKYPGWPNNVALPFLISLANSVQEDDRVPAAVRLMEETLARRAATSHHDRLRIHNSLISITYTDNEIQDAVIACEDAGKAGRLTFGSALRIGLGGDGATARTIEILTLMSKPLTAIA